MSSTTPRQGSSRRLAASLLLVFVVLALVPVSVVTVFSAFVQADLARDNARDKLVGVAAAKTRQIEDWLGSTQATLLLNLTNEPTYLDALAIFAEPSSSPAFGQATDEFGTHVELMSVPEGPFNRVMLADPSGGVVWSSERFAQGADISDFTYFQDGRLQSNVTAPFVDPLDDERGIFFSTPVRDPEGTLIGVLIGRAPTVGLEELSADRTGLGDTGEILLVSADSGYLTELRFAPSGDLQMTEGVADALSGGDGWGIFTDYRGETVISVYHWLPDLEVALIVKQDLQEATLASRALVRTNLVMAGLALLAALSLGLVFSRRITRPIVNLTDTAVRIAEGDRSLRVKAGRADEIGALAGAFNEMTERVQGLVDTLEVRVDERTRDLETTVEISRAITGVRDLDILLEQVTQMICDRYGYYHAQVFLLDDVREHAVLRASTGEIGKLLLQRQHSLAVGSRSVIGEVTSGGEFVVAHDTDTSTVHSRNELLPDTRSELALPLRVGERILGALDVQSVEPDAFDAETIQVLQAVADQLSIAINNVQLFEETQALLRDQIQLSQLLTREGWSDYLARKSGVKGFTYDLSRARPLSGGTQELGEAHSSLNVPIRLRGEVIGELVSLPGDGMHWDEEEQLLVEAVADRVALALENARLHDETRERAAKLEAVNLVGQAATSILDIDALLPHVIDLILESFGYYHVQVFLVDEHSGQAVLFASTGDVGEELLARGHALEVGSKSVIGKVTAEGVPVIARDTDSDAIHRRNELLPDTRSELAIPLQHGNRVIGALDVQSVQPDAFKQEDIVILNTLADQLSVALENAQLFQDIQVRVAELTTVNLISQEVSQALTLDALFQTVSEQLMRSFEANDGFLVLYDKATGMLEYPIVLEDNEPVEVKPLPFGKGPVSRVIETRMGLLLNEGVAEAVEEMGGDPRAAKAKSWLGVPLNIGNEVVGVLGIQNRLRENAYDVGRQRMLATLAAYLAVAIRNAQLFQQTEQRAAELGFLFDVTSSALRPTDLNETLQRVADSVGDEIKNAEATLVALSGETGEHLVPRAAAGYGREVLEKLGTMPVGEGVIGMVAAAGKPILVADLREESGYHSHLPESVSEVAVPLIVGDEVVGVLDVQSKMPGAFGEDDLRLLQTLSGTLSAIIQNARLIERIRAANEQLRELDVMKTQFLANMSHELRTPLNSIIGFSRVILKGIDGPVTDLQEQDLQTIYGSGQHLLGLINDILDMSKIEAGKLDLALEMVDLRVMFEGVMSTTSGLVNDKPIRLVTETHPDLPEVYVDEMRIRQVLLNLLSNAAKFTHEGTITVRAHPVQAEDGKPGYVQIDVEDTGIGVGEEDLQRLFEPFSQVDASTTRAVGGTGLGLSISRSLVQLHGGQIWVKSEEGAGSTFSLSIPHHRQPTQTDVLPVVSPRDVGKPVVLAVDDDQDVLSLYRRLLEKEGYAFLTMSGGHAVVEAVRLTKPAVVLLDVMMPDRDGWEVLTDLKLNPDTRDVPIVLCTIVEERERAFKMGAAEYLAKPIPDDRLMEAVHRLASETNGQRPDELVEELQADAEEPVEVPPQEKHSPGDGKSTSVLVIDDEPSFVEFLRDGLQDINGFSVTAAIGGEAGLDAVRVLKPDAIIMDIGLHELDGFQVLSRLQESDDTRAIPVLILATYDLTPEDFSRLTEQAVGLISKSEDDRDNLLKRIAHALDGIL